MIMKWYKIIKLLIEVLSFGLLTYEKVNREREETVEDDSSRSDSDSKTDN